MQFSAELSIFNDMIALFTTHPESVNETYGMHFTTALKFAGALFLAGGACAVHAVFPWLCTKTASRRVAALHDRMVTNRARH
jgi:hypothetical protein